MNRNEHLEERLIRQLTEGELQADDPGKAAVRRLPPRFVAVIRTEYDPVTEETHKYRQMAEEVDDRYDNRLRTRQDDAADGSSTFQE